MVARPILDTQITIVITLVIVPDAQLKSHGGFDMKRVEIVRDDLKRYFMLWNIDAQEYISDLVTFEPLHFASFDDAKRYAEEQEYIVAND